MGRLDATFERLAADGKKALVIYLTAGDPDLDTSVRAAIAAVKAGADIIEVGVPFSDPLADGPVIQRAMNRALANGCNFDGALEVVSRLRAETDAPIVVFGYINPLLWKGFEVSARSIREAGGDGILVVDVPPEEAGVFRDTARQHELDWVSLIAPTSGPERAARIAEGASGFLYVISMTGTTGGDLTSTDAAERMIAAARTKSQLPACVGFGVRDAATARAAAEAGEGVVVGSAVVRALESGGPDEGIARLEALVGELRRGIDSAKA